MFEPLSRTRSRPAQLITRRKVGRPTRDRAASPEESLANDTKADIESVEVVLYALGVNGRTTMSQFIPRGQFIDSYA